jgi:hypothetical protein
MVCQIARTHVIGRGGRKGWKHPDLSRHLRARSCNVLGLLSWRLVTWFLKCFPLSVRDGI